MSGELEKIPSEIEITSEMIDAGAELLLGGPGEYFDLPLSIARGLAERVIRAALLKAARRPP